MIRAVAPTTPAFLVMAARVRAEQHATWFQASDEGRVSNPRLPVTARRSRLRLRRHRCSRRTNKPSFTGSIGPTLASRTAAGDLQFGDLNLCHRFGSADLAISKLRGHEGSKFCPAGTA